MKASSMTATTFRLWTATALCFLLTSTVNGFDYNITKFSVSLSDYKTGISDLQTIFTNDITNVSVSDIKWSYTGIESGNSILSYTTLVNGEIQAEGTHSLVDVERELPTSFDVGSITVGKSGSATVEVILEVDSMSVVESNTYQAYAAGVSIVPLVLILVLAMTTHMVELSLFLGVLVGACIVAGTLRQGFMDTLNVYLLDALADYGHVYVILFTVFLSGTVGMMQKSGGMLGFTRDVARFATTARSGQFACMFVGIIIFFDDYSNVLLAGETMRPLLDLLSVSREKLSFIVDATSAPIASISPISSWVGFEVGLIDEQLAIIKDQVAAAGGELTINDSAFGIFLQSIKYRYYPIFMIVLMIFLVSLQRDFGPMLVAERQVRVYDRTDGGPNKGKTGEMDGDDQNQPKKDQPLLGMNMLVPVLVLVITIFMALINSGDDGSGTQSFMDKIEGSDSYVALLYGTMGAAWMTLIFYLMQITIPGTGTLAWWTPQNISAMLPWNKDNTDSKPRFLMTVPESVNAFLFGMSRIFMALIVLCLAWASGHVMSSVGANRLFASWITEGVAPELLPTLSFLISLLMALATGTSWGTMSILFPLILVPTYWACNGDELIFYSVVAGVLSGSVAGDHMSPISDTTVLSALACDVTLVAHVQTQAPYVLVIILFSVLFGTLPIGYGAWPNMVGMALGWAFCLAFVYVICVPVIAPTGCWDIFTKYCCSRQHGADFLERLTEDTIKKYNGETVEMKCDAEDISDMLEKAAYKEDDNSEGSPCPSTEAFESTPSFVEEP